jgi:hypothetical protein
MFCGFSRPDTAIRSLSSCGADAWNRNGIGSGAHTMMERRRAADPGRASQNATFR